MKETLWLLLPAGAPRFLGYELTQAIHEVLITETIDATWSRRAREVIATERAMHVFLQDERTPVTSESDELTWWNYAGGKANLELARLIEAELGGQCVVRNSSITCKDEAGQSVVALRELIRRLAGQDGRIERTLAAGAILSGKAASLEVSAVFAGVTVERVSG